MKALIGQKSVLFGVSFWRKFPSQFQVQRVKLRTVLKIFCRIKKPTQYSILCFESVRIYYSASKCSVMLVWASTLLLQPTNIIS